MIEIIQPGPIATVQDTGRVGHRNIGVGTAGAMDRRALDIGNILTGNTPDAAAIEFTLGGFAVRFLEDQVIALTGADANARLDGKPLPSWWVRHVRAGQELRAGPSTDGMRSYLCVSGGIDVPAVLGSRATDLKGAFGGHEGRMLRAGDRLTVLDKPQNTLPEGGFGLSAARLGFMDPPGELPVIRFVPAAEWADLSPEDQIKVQAQSWKLRPDSNRMGYRFEGQPVVFETHRELLSHGILPGTIQLPPDGLPAIQMNDANTCGGYPKLGVVIDADMPRLAQIRLGTEVRFEAVDRETALAVQKEHTKLLSVLPLKIRLASDYAQRWGMQ
ncbi:biotin-dependent carboxyltransferase family protein [Celeribacter sp.]|uniref:5-oxoprolinase subunit C family protein n=1 Tax=Celeribacter sp. TaxID=1890673 RepID=UPI003A90767F